MLHSVCCMARYMLCRVGLCPQATDEIQRLMEREQQDTSKLQHELSTATRSAALFTALEYSRVP